MWDRLMEFLSGLDQYKYSWILEKVHIREHRSVNDYYILKLYRHVRVPLSGLTFKAELNTITFEEMSEGVLEFILDDFKDRDSWVSGFDIKRKQ